MNQNSEIFVDGLMSVSISGGVVRITFGELAGELAGDSASAASQQQAGLAVTTQKTPPLKAKHRLLMPLEGFIRSFETISNVMKRLEEKGVIKRKAGNGASPRAAQ